MNKVSNDHGSAADLALQLKFYRISQEEYANICALLGRAPQGLEMALFSALWSEHCSYKSSRVHLRKFYNKNQRVVEAFGENAGVVDLGQGERIAFKMESHNHPSFIEPYQGAATGVGGILRDIFTMGARPIASADYLCFGEPEAERMAVLVDGVVRGIGGYGNCVGVPTVTGQTEFHESYNGNILVNAMAVGLFRPADKIFLSQAKGPGNWVVYVGAKTGRDGIHGASMASESFDDDLSRKKPNVQIGDPFFEKLLIESCLEVMHEDLVVAIQDMGAAGLTSSSFEMAAKGGVGLRLWLDKIPLRDRTATPEDILLSESQERMLLVCEPAKFARLQSIFHKWGLDATHVGEVIGLKRVELLWQNEVVVNIDPDLLVANAPAYNRPFAAWQPRNRVSNRDEIKWQIELKQFVPQMLGDVRGCSREWIFRQYDQRVGGATVRDAESDVAVLTLPDSRRLLGIALGCRPYVMRFDTRVGAIDSVIYPALELSAKGFLPLAITDCLNFGNPEKQDTMTDFVAAISGINEVCLACDLPVVSGNVSFYNETLGKNISPTPTIGMIGLRTAMTAMPFDHFTVAGDEIFLITLPQLVMGGYAQDIMAKVIKGVGELEPVKVATFMGAVRNIITSTDVRATRVVGKFGLAYTLARMAIGQEIGCKVSGILDKSDWFMEHFYQVICVVAADNVPAFNQQVTQQQQLLPDINVVRLGVTGGSSVTIQAIAEWQVGDLRQNYNQGWGQKFEKLG